MRIYISICVNAIARITPETPYNIIGIGTENLKTCVAVFIFNDKAMSVTHVNFKTDLNSLLDEIKIVGDKYSIILVHNTAERLSHEAQLRLLSVTDMPKLINLVSDFLRSHTQTRFKTYDTSTGEAYLNRDGELCLNSKELTAAQIVFSPQAELRYAIQYFNNTFSETDSSPDVEFNGKEFCKPKPLGDAGQSITREVRPYLRQRNLLETEENISKYLENELVPKMPTTKLKHDLFMIKDILANQLGVILENSFSKQDHENRPSFFRHVKNVTILYAPAARFYAASLAHCISSIDSDESATPAAKVNHHKEKMKVPLNDSANNHFIMPLSWLKQLKEPAITELASEFNLDEASFKKSFKM